MPTWKPLEDYSPFARVLVTYMWDQRPPLLPIEFARQMGVRKQQVSSWLTTQVVPDPPLLVHLARRMGMPVRDLLVAAGDATPEDPLLDVTDAWAYVHHRLDEALAEAAVGAETLEALDAPATEGPLTETIAALRAFVTTVARRDQERLQGLQERLDARLPPATFSPARTKTPERASTAAEDAEGDAMGDVEEDTPEGEE